MPLCSECDEALPRTSFSSSQLKKPSGSRTCCHCQAKSEADPDARCLTNTIAAQLASLDLGKATSRGDENDEESSTDSQCSGGFGLDTEYTQKLRFRVGDRVQLYIVIGEEDGESRSGWRSGKVIDRKIKRLYTDQGAYVMPYLVQMDDYAQHGDVYVPADVPFVIRKEQREEGDCKEGVSTESENEVAEEEEDEEEVAQSSTNKPDTSDNTKITHPVPRTRRRPRQWQ